MREDLGNDEIIGRFGENPGKNTGKALGCMGKICDFFIRCQEMEKSLISP